jgi:hypothetical protein
MTITMLRLLASFFMVVPPEFAALFSNNPDNVQDIFQTKAIITLFPRTASAGDSGEFTG